MPATRPFIPSSHIALPLQISALPPVPRLHATQTHLPIPTYQAHHITHTRPKMADPQTGLIFGVPARQITSRTRFAWQPVHDRAFRAFVRTDAAWLRTTGPKTKVALDGLLRDLGFAPFLRVVTDAGEPLRRVVEVKVRSRLYGAARDWRRDCEL